MIDEYKKIISCLNKNTVVSFDVFDTLLLRPFVSPTDIFYYIEDVYSCKGFATRRINAEKRSRKRKIEVTLDDIYSEDPWLDKYKKIEQETEIQLIFPNPYISELYEIAKKNAKSVIITTDIYFDKSYMIELLHKNGYEGFDDIYVSCEYNATKKDSSLFKVILEEYPVLDIVHIGDNPVSDYESPRKNGIKAFCIKKCEDIYLCKKSYRMNNLKTWQESLFVKMCSVRNRVTYNDYWHELGFELIGPICYAYSMWIYGEIQKKYPNNELDICFVSRDGYLLQKCYEIISGQATKYIYAPRNINGILQNQDDNDFTKKTLIREYETYINGVVNAKEVVLVDTRTQNFSSQKLLLHFLNAKVYGLYYINSIDDQTLEYSSYHPTRNNPILSWNMIEYFLSSPTSSVVAINNGMPLYAKTDDIEEKRQRNFINIERGVLEFMESICEFKTNFNILEKQVTDWVNDFLQNPSAKDKEVFKSIKFANDSMHEHYELLNPFLEKPKSIKDYREYILRKLVLYPRLYGIVRKIYRRVKRLSE